MRWLSLTIFSVGGFIGCQSDPFDHVLHGTISYPFVETNPLGINGEREKFVIRSIVGSTEYVVEIPGAGEDYDIEVPLAELEKQGLGKAGSPKNLAPPNKTDRELLEALPNISKINNKKSSLMDKAFGAGKAKGPGQAPSYSVGLAKINRYYKLRQYEYALIETNHLLAYYPNSPKLHKMKGTILIKLRNLSLAEKSWNQALELTPYDRALRQGLTRLKKKIKDNLESPTLPAGE